MISVRAWRCPFLTLYPFLLFFLNTITLSSFKCFKTLASTIASFTVGFPSTTLEPLSNNKTLSKVTLSPSLTSNLSTNNFVSFSTLNCFPEIFTIAFINFIL